MLIFFKFSMDMAAKFIVKLTWMLWTPKNCGNFNSSNQFGRVHRYKILGWFAGLRHDSGDPIEWGEKAIAHYQSLRIDVSTKRLVFSDGLDVPRALAIYRHFADRVQLGFGIGTNLTNDLGPTPLNIVMKLARCNGMPTAKLPDTPGKTYCSDETFLAYLRQVFGREAD